MALYDEIVAKCSPELIASKEHGLIAEKVSEGRTGPSNYQLGKGDVVEVIGIEAANTALDAVDNAEMFRHVKHLLAEGRMNSSSDTFTTALYGLVSAGALSQPNADKLAALGVKKAPVSVYEVIQAMEGK